MKKKIAIIITLIILLNCCVLGCHSDSTSKNTSKYQNFITVDVYDSLSNYQGIQPGWFGEYVKSKFNMELNIIAPNVTGDADALYDSRFMTGDIGDLIISSASDGNLQKLVDANLVINMEPYLSNKEILTNYGNAIASLNEDIRPGGIYAIPSNITYTTPTTPSEGNALAYGTYLRWDLYAELGYPVIETLEDLLPILKDMQKLCPYSDTGKPTYAFSFFSDWDGNLMMDVKQPCCFYGYDEYGFTLVSADGTDIQNIVDKDSLYYRVLKFYFAANQMGLVDPDSRTQNYDSTFQKLQDGQLLYSPWPWSGQSAYNTEKHLEQGKAFMFVPIKDENIYSVGSNECGTGNTVIAIGSQAEDPERLADFIDWLYSDEGIYVGCAERNLCTAGPEGLTWEMSDDGPVLTEFGINLFIEGKDMEVPDEYGGGTWLNGTSKLNFRPVTQKATTKDGYYYYYALWDSVKELQLNDIETDWSNHMGGAVDMIDYVTSHNQISVAPGCSFDTVAATTEITTIRRQCAELIRTYSWDMVFAEDEETFNTLYDQLLIRLEAFGYDTVLSYDITNAQKLCNARQEVLSQE